MSVPKVVAHRGYAKRYPENTLIGIEAALQAGACFVEFDVQLTADKVPVLLHDASLLRTTGLRKRVQSVSFEQVKALQIDETKRLRKRYKDVTVPTLAEVVALLRKWPKAVAFVEVKKESLESFGIEFTIKRVLRDLQPCIEQFVVISTSSLAIRCARAMGAREIGWVLARCDKAARDITAEFVPDYLFCNYTKLPKSGKALWAGPWKWVLYEVTTPKLALELATRGAEFIETMAVSELFKHPLLKSRGCFAA